MVISCLGRWVVYVREAVFLPAVQRGGGRYPSARRSRLLIAPITNSDTQPPEKQPIKTPPATRKPRRGGRSRGRDEVANIAAARVCGPHHPGAAHQRLADQRRPGNVVGQRL